MRRTDEVEKVRDEVRMLRREIMTLCANLHDGKIPVRRFDDGTVSLVDYETAIAQIDRRECEYVPWV